MSPLGPSGKGERRQGRRS